ncbi:helix-turn-helix domain-containing protein [Lonepinella sp. MS14435]|uniref:helix-turn-helix domain-containing protein n=1 Tax=Lonepinella sp. MS14435 TaxID=3003618 RepID=UPI0036DF0680
MTPNQKIRLMREEHNWSQEEMAEKLNMSPSGYAKFERGETRLYLDKLEKIAHIFNIDLTELLNERNICVLISENSQQSSNYYGDNNAILLELEKLKVADEFKNQIIQQKDNEIASLKEIIALLKNKG